MVHKKDVSPLLPKGNLHGLALDDAAMDKAAELQSTAGEVNVEKLNALGFDDEVEPFVVTVPMFGPEGESYPWTRRVHVYPKTLTSL